MSAWQQLDAQQWAQRCNADGEFQLAARHWRGGLRLKMGDRSLILGVTDGIAAEAGDELADDSATSAIITYAGAEAVWQDVLSQTPSRFHNDLMANVSAGAGLTVQGDKVIHAQYYPAIMRAVELLRPAPQPYPLRDGDVASAGHMDTPVGRYVHVDLQGVDYRIYYEEAGQGIPLLLQHTAGCHGSQWRHLFEMPEITSRYRLIAYDLPYHGKSLPPVVNPWWSERYDLQGDFLRGVPLALAQALKLEQPVFMGCSVGGLLALDLAYRHADVFRAVISVEGALQIPGSSRDLGELWHPQVSNEYKARLMDGLMSPTSPMAYRKETSFVYASGWPPAFLGDLYYYCDDYDLREVAHEIDTQQVGVHILSGEYDYSGTAELGQEAHAAIAGSSWQLMEGVGHFPMSENPLAFKSYLLPILERIAAEG